MFLSEAEAEAKLQDLRRRRDALDRLIADHLLYLELGRRLPEAPAPAAEPPAGAASGETGPGLPREGPGQESPGGESLRREGRALVAAALGALRAAGRPLHAREILERVTEQGFRVAGRDPVAALNTRLWKRSGPGGPLRRLGDAVYAPAQDDAG